MPREIKFRAWTDNLKDGGEMYYQEYSKSLSPIFSPAGYGLGNPSLIIMQFTGLKDKNGVEIYEGDIGTDVNDEWYEVKFDNGAFIVIHDGNVIEELSEVADGMGIIGNIYENPELIK